MKLFTQYPKCAPYIGIGDTFQCCDCGAVKVYPPNDGGSGFAIVDGRQLVCYECCAVRDAKQMRDTGAIVLYLHSDADASPVYVGNWPGTLRFPVGRVKMSWHNFAGRNGRVDFWFTAYGKQWHGVNIGDNQLAHCKALKG